MVCNLGPVCACVRNWLGHCIACLAVLYFECLALLKDSNVMRSVGFFDLADERWCGRVQDGFVWQLQRYHVLS